MTTIAHDDIVIDAESATDAAAPARRRGLTFWITRYLPAEIVGTAAMVMAGSAATLWTDNPALIALAALAGELVGFYVVLAFTILLEQTPIARTRRAALGRTGMLLAAEFGVAELLDTLIIRPAALLVGVWLFADPLWGVLAGKIFADVVFYAISAGAFTITAETGLRDGSRAGSHAESQSDSRATERAT